MEVRTLEQVKTYRDKVNAIKLDVETHYKNLLDKEQNSVKRIILNIKMRVSIGREIAKLDSLAKLHLKAKQI